MKMKEYVYTALYLLFGLLMAAIGFAITAYFGICIYCYIT